MPPKSSIKKAGLSGGTKKKATVSVTATAPPKKKAALKKRLHDDDSDSDHNNSGCDSVSNSGSDSGSDNSMRGTHIKKSKIPAIGGAVDSDDELEHDEFDNDIEDDIEDTDKDDGEDIDNEENDYNATDIERDEAGDEDCAYAPPPKKMLFNDDEVSVDDNFDDVVPNNNKVVYVTDENRITTNKLTKYERVNLIGTRAQQIALGAQRMIPNTDHLTPVEVAKLELINKVSPFYIKRSLPMGKVELIDVNTLTIYN